MNRPFAATIPFSPQFIRWLCSPSRLRSALLLLLVLSVAGCSTLPNLTDRDKFSRAFRNAVTSKMVIIPAIGAGLFSIGELDRRTSNWAAGHNPVFASEKTARDFSNFGLITLQAETAATSLIAPPQAPSSSLLERPAVELFAFGAVFGTTDILKSSVDRARPDRSNDRSFPSSHSSLSFSLATLSNRNLDYISCPALADRCSFPLSEESAGRLQFANVALASAVGWARIEGRKHYPTDVLAGAAIGNFLSIFIHDWLIGQPAGDDVTFILAPASGGAFASLAFSF